MSIQEILNSVGEGCEVKGSFLLSVDFSVLEPEVVVDIFKVDNDTFRTTESSDANVQIVEGSVDLIAENCWLDIGVVFVEVLIVSGVAYEDSCRLVSVLEVSKEVVVWIEVKSLPLVLEEDVVKVDSKTLLDGSLLGLMVLPESVSTTHRSQTTKDEMVRPQSTSKPWKPKEPLG